jgi:hypothetical protein
MRKMDMETITALSVASVRYTDDPAALGMEVVFSHIPDQVLPFTARQDDPEQLGRDLFEQAMAGEFGDITPYEAPPAHLEHRRTLKLLLDRAQRYMGPLLDAVDLGVATPEERELLAQWQSYRVSLMRLTTASVATRDLRWPEPPAAPF